MSERLKKLFEEIVKIIKMYKPNCVAIESLFFFNNQKTVISVGQARGVLILAAAQKNLPIFDYTPLQVKQAVSGYGKASKVQVQKMVKLILNLEELPKPDDAADALAISICHLNTKRY
jgi:crossover junction endodeoxyribonuclease RuvC